MTSRPIILCPFSFALFGRAPPNMGFYSNNGTFVAIFGVECFLVLCSVYLKRSSGKPVLHRFLTAVTHPHPHPPTPGIRNWTAVGELQIFTTGIRSCTSLTPRSTLRIFKRSNFKYNENLIQWKSHSNTKPFPSVPGTTMDIMTSFWTW